jgi:glycosyltransferase involved in cell wall biosynthesis
VDDASTDATPAVAVAAGARVVKVALRKISAVRNAGAKAASGETFIFLDADTLLNETVLRQAVWALRQGAVGGGCAALFDGRLPGYSKWLTPAINAFSRCFGLAYGCFLFCTRQGFEAAGGFDEGLYAAEEWALSRALKKQGRFMILREAVVTSGRKMRAYSGRELLGFFGAIAARPGSLRGGKGLEIWYGERREDPE